MIDSSITKKDRILITGATGFIGSSLTRFLVREKYNIHIFLRKKSDNWRIKDLLSYVHTHNVDITEEKILENVVKKIKPSIIFHLANIGMYKGENSPEKLLLNVNLQGTINLINALKTVNYRCLINTGSSSEYGHKEGKMKESDSCYPSNFYAITKLAATLYCSQIAILENKPIVTLRLFSPFGPYDDPRRLISYVFTQAFQNKSIKLTNPIAVRDYIFVNDVIDAYLCAVKVAKKNNGTVFNIGSSQQISIYDTANQVLKATNSKSKILFSRPKKTEKESDEWEADISLAAKKLKWRPRNSFESAIKATATWFKKNLAYYL